MNQHPLIRQLLVLISLALAIGFPLAYAIAPQQKATDHHDHAAGEEEHDEHGEEEKHADEHENGKAEKNEKGHGHAEEAHGEHEEEEGGTRFGPDKAITAANKKDGIQLSEKAIKTLGLGYVVAKGEGTFKLPLGTAVFFQDEVGVYRLKNGWHKLVEVQLISKTATDVVVKTSELNSGDQIAKDGVPLLRAAELEAWGGSGDGHGH